MTKTEIGLILAGALVLLLATMGAIIRDILKSRRSVIVTEAKEEEETLGIGS